MSIFEFQKKFSNEKACKKYLLDLKWENGFSCKKCGYTKYRLAKKEFSRRCNKCNHEDSPTAGTLFHATKLSLRQWFWSIYWVSSDKGSVSALRLSKLIGVSWRTANKMLRKLRTAMGHQDSLYHLRDSQNRDILFPRKPCHVVGPPVLACPTSGYSSDSLRS